MLLRLGRGIYRVRWFFLIISLLIVGVAGYYGIGALDKLQGISNITDPTSESTRAQNLLFQKLGNNNSSDVILLLSSDHLQADDPAFQKAATQLYDKLKARPEVGTITSYYTNKSPQMISRDKQKILMTITFAPNKDPKYSYNSIAPLFTAPSLRVDAGGWVASDGEFNQQVNTDLVNALVISLPLLALFLFFVFGGLIAGLLPLLIGIIATIGSFAILRILVSFMDVSDIATHVIAFVSLGLAIDYSLFIVTRFREELESHQNDVPAALGRTMATAGRTVLFSGLTVGTSLLCLLIFPEVLLRSVGLAAIASALVAVVASLTILPALLALLGKHVNALSLRRLFRRKISSEQQGMWYRMAQFAMRWSIPVTLLIIALDIVLGSPFLRAQFSTPDERSLPSNASARIVVQHLRQDFVGVSNSSIEIAVTTSGDALSSQNLALLNSYVKKLQNVHKVESVISLVTLDPKLTLADYQKLYANTSANPQIASAAKQLAKGNFTEIIVKTTVADHAPEARNVAQVVHAVAVPAGLKAIEAGNAAAEVHLLNSLQVTIPRALMIMLGSIFLLLFLFTGSLLMPLKAIVLNVFSLSATFGALVWIFQEGHLQNLLGFQPVGSLDSSQTVLIFAIAFGLSMDYEVFLLSRIKEQFDRTGNNRESVAVGLQRTGWLITCAALLLALVTGAFAASQIIFLKEIGVGIALAVLMDAVLIRCLLVPAMMRLLGSANWWAPRPLKVAWSYIGLKETPEAVSIPIPERATMKLPDAHTLMRKMPVETVPREGFVMARTMNSTPAIEVKHLYKSYQKRRGEVVHAVQDLNLSVPAGQVLGFLGANGAGKTTTIKMICGLVIPTSGSIYVNGYELSRQHSMVMRQIGAVLEGTRNVYWRLTPWQNLRYFGQLKGHQGKELQIRAEQLLRELDLWDRRNDPIRTFSRGMQQKVAIACSLIADPPIVLLDEPTLGLDIQAAQTVKEWINMLARQRGKTVVLTTHQLDIAQELCDHVAIMRKGQLLTNLPLPELLHHFQEEYYQVRVRGVIPEAHKGLFGALKIEVENGETTLSGPIRDQKQLQNMLSFVYSLQLSLLSVERCEPDLEEVFLRLMEGQQALSDRRELARS